VPKVNEQTKLRGNLVKIRVVPFRIAALFFLLEWPYRRMTSLRKTNLNSLDFVVNRFFIKTVQTGNIDLVKCCQSYFCFELPSVLHDRLAKIFDIKYRNYSNVFCQMISHL